MCPQALAAQRAARAKAHQAAQRARALPARAPAPAAPPPSAPAAPPPSAPEAPAPAETPAPQTPTLLQWGGNLFGLGDHHGAFYKLFTNVTGVPGPKGHGGVVTAATNVAHDEWAFRGDSVAALYQLAQGHPAAAARYNQAATEAMNRNLEVVKNLIPFGGSHGLIAQYGEVVFDNAYGLDDDAVEALNRANADAADQAYNDPVDFALNFVPVAAEGRALLIGRLTAIERDAARMGNAARAAQAGRALAHIRRADELMGGGRLGTRTRAQAAALVKRVQTAARTKVAAVSAARQMQKARPRSPAEVAAVQKKFDRLQAGLLARARLNTARAQRPAYATAAGRGTPPPPAARPGPAPKGPVSRPVARRVSVATMAARASAAGASSIPKVKLPKGSPPKMGVKTKFPIPVSIRKRMDALLVKRNAQVRLRDRLLAREARQGLTPVEARKLSRAKAQINEASRRLGDVAATEYVQTHYPGAVKQYPAAGAPSRSGDFDQIWKQAGAGPGGTDKWIVVESKGGKSDLKWQEIGGARQQQGTKSYFEYVADTMSNNGYNIGATLRAAQKAGGDIEYILVKAPYKTTGGVPTSLGDIQITPFGIK